MGARISFSRDAARWGLITLPLAPLAGAMYLFSEWMFVVTKPSATAGLEARQQLLVLLGAVLPLCLPLVAVQVVASLISIVAHPRFRAVACGPASVVLGFLLLMLLDNFTYTIFGFGIIRAGEAMRLVYAAALPVLIVTAWRELVSWSAHASRLVTAAPIALVVTALVTGAPVVVREAVPSPAAPPPGVGPLQRRTLPNILFLGMDGIDASILSAYGYERRTSPFLDKVRDESLFFENAFSNATRTHGSLVTLLTGRLPFSTRVTFPPTVLQGQDARRTLPALLKQAGYTTLQIGMRHYADAEDTNVAGFDAANYRWKALTDIWQQPAHADEVEVFRTAVAERLEERVGRILGRPAAPDVFAHVEGRQVAPMWRDERRVATVIDFIDQAPQPWFVHLHLLDTHCCQWRADRAHFSDGPSAEIDARDSQVRETDANVRRLFAALSRSGRLDRTIVVISSDHASMWKTTERVPLMIRFPRMLPRGRVRVNVQLADVAPTMVEYLGLAAVDWMEGLSLLQADRLPPGRSIFGVSDIKRRDGAPGLRLLRDGGPPNFGASAAMMIAGSEWFEMSLLDGTLRSGEVTGHTGTGLPRVSEAAARAALQQKLASAGFAVERASFGR